MSGAISGAVSVVGGGGSLLGAFVVMCIALPIVGFLLYGEKVLDWLDRKNDKNKR
jgi:hypothetical protein